jgi:hypothetical protein
VRRAGRGGSSSMGRARAPRGSRSAVSSNSIRPRSVIRSRLRRAGTARAGQRVQRCGAQTSILRRPWPPLDAGACSRAGAAAARRLWVRWDGGRPGDEDGGGGLAAGERGEQVVDRFRRCVAAAGRARQVACRDARPSGCGSGPARKRGGRPRAPRTAQLEAAAGRRDALGAVAGGDQRVGLEPGGGHRCEPPAPGARGSRGASAAAPAGAAARATATARQECGALPAGPAHAPPPQPSRKARRDVRYHGVRGRPAPVELSSDGAT